jgi:hypothetical protein
VAATVEAYAARGAVGERGDPSLGSRGIWV